MQTARGIIASNVHEVHVAFIVPQKMDGSVPISGELQVIAGLQRPEFDPVKYTCTALVGRDTLRSDRTVPR